MPIQAYKCSICGDVFDREEQAAKCESKGLAALPRVGLVFRWYQTNRLSFIAIVTKAEHDGHMASASYSLYRDDSRTLHAGKPLNQHPIGAFRDREIWQAVGELVGAGIKPYVLVSDEDEYGGKVVDLDELVAVLAKMKECKRDDFY